MDLSADPGMSWGDLHRNECAPGWVYGVVWRFVNGKATPPKEPLGPPKDLGKLTWELNTDRAWDQGCEVTTPGWSDGTRHMQATYWRARLPRGLTSWAVRQTRHKRLPDA